MNVPKKINSFFIFGLGVSGLSAALFLKKKSQSIFCWDDDLKKRIKATQKKLNIDNYNTVNFKKVDSELY